MLPSSLSEHKEVEELGDHPRRVWAGGGGQPAVGQDNAHQAREDHGSKRHGTVLLSSTNTKDTVINAVKVYTLECGYMGCAFHTGDHMSRALGYHKGLLEFHFTNEHIVPPLEMEEGAVDRDHWNTFVEWWRHYTAVMEYPEEDNRRLVLQWRLGEAGTALSQKLGTSTSSCQWLTSC
jgi:hypothetical protein